jgi:hypothetical protein
LGYPIRRPFTAILHVYGEIGAEQSTQTTIDTVRIIQDFRRMVPAGICVSCHFDDAFWTELNAEATSFAAFFDHVNNTVRYFYSISIQRLSPISHGFSLENINRLYPGL